MWLAVPEVACSEARWVGWVGCRGVAGLTDELVEVTLFDAYAAADADGVDFAVVDPLSGLPGYLDGVAATPADLGLVWMVGLDNQSASRKAISLSVSL